MNLRKQFEKDNLMFRYSSTETRIRTTVVATSQISSPVPVATLSDAATSVQVFSAPPLIVVLSSLKEEEPKKKAVEAFKPNIPYHAAFVRERSKYEMRIFLETFQTIVH